jgi:hypothetical protein
MSPRAYTLPSHGNAMSDLVLGRAMETGDDYDVLIEDTVVGYIMLSDGAPAGTPWMWTIAHGYYEGRTPTHGFEATRESALQAFARSWRKET